MPYGFLDSLGVTGLSSKSATVYAVAHHVPKDQRIVFGYGEPSDDFTYPVNDNFFMGTGEANQNLWLVMHDKLIPETLYSWVAEIRDLDEHVLFSTAVQSFKTAGLGRGHAKGAHLFAPGNEFWKMRSSFGALANFHSAEALWQACTEYFQWCEDNPLYEDAVFAYKGDISHEPIAKMRAMTIGSMCIFIGISYQNWVEYRTRDHFKAVTSLVDEIIKAQKFQGAAAGLLNPTVIIRDLGIADKSEVTGADGAPLLDAERFTSSIASLVARSREASGA